MNIAQRLRETAERVPHQPAVICPAGRDSEGRVAYTHVSFRQLDRESDSLARGMRLMGVVPGTRLVLMVRFGIEFVSIVFASFKAGAVIVLVDPGMGLSRVMDCIEEIEPEGLLAIPPIHAVRVLSRRRFRRSRRNITVGRRWFWGGPTYRSLVRAAWEPFEPASVRDTDAAAVIFTSGSTGSAKGVIYEHGMFNAQVDMIRDQYAIEPGGVDLSGFPLFGLFNAAMGTTTVIPPMNPSRPGRANPRRIVETIEDQAVTQSFGSPALWNRVSRYCREKGRELPTLRRILSAGAPVPLSLVEQLTALLPSRTCAGGETECARGESPDSAKGNGRHFDSPDKRCCEIHTPYGATEALPVTTISAREILEQTAERTRTGAGTCVGRPFRGIRVKIIEIVDRPIAAMSEATERPAGQIGEIIVQGRCVTRGYFRRPEADAAAKIPDGSPSAGPGATATFWHRMGDVGYLDDQGRLWYCGRKSQIVTTPKERLFTEPCEAVFNQHPRVARSALVGVDREGATVPVVIVEPVKGAFPLWPGDRQKFSGELRDLAAANPLTLDIHRILFHRSLPVDVRHNSKINRERLALWAANALHGRS